jgi:hypothetical protein
MYRTIEEIRVGQKGNNKDKNGIREERNNMAGSNLLFTACFCILIVRKARPNFGELSAGFQSEPVGSGFVTDSESCFKHRQLRDLNSIYITNQRKQGKRYERNE